MAAALPARRPELYLALGKVLHRYRLTAVRAVERYSPGLPSPVRNFHTSHPPPAHSLPICRPSRPPYLREPRISSQSRGLQTTAAHTPESESSTATSDEIPLEDESAPGRIIGEDPPTPVAEVEAVLDQPDHQLRPPRKSPHRRPRPEWSPSQRLALQTKQVLRRIPYPVAIVTAAEATPPPETTLSPSEKPRPAYLYHGMTISSLTSVSMSPVPMLSFNARNPSATAAAIRSSGRFCIHLLGVQDVDTLVAAHFHDPKRKPWVLHSEREVEDADRWEQSICTIRCEKGPEMKVGDHSIMTGEVKSVFLRRNRAGQGMRRPLLYREGGYTSFREVMLSSSRGEDVRHPLKRILLRGDGEEGWKEELGKRLAEVRMGMPDKESVKMASVVRRIRR